MFVTFNFQCLDRISSLPDNLEIAVDAGRRADKGIREKQTVSVAKKG